MTPSVVSAPESAPEKVKGKRRPNPRILLAIALLAVAGYLGWRQFAPKPAATVLHVSGRIEADETEIDAKVGGRLVKVLPQEGDKVKAGQVVVEIQDEEINQQLLAAAAQVRAAQEEVAQARFDVEVAESRIREAETNVLQSQGESQGQVEQASSIVAANKAQVAEAIAQVRQAEAAIQQAEAERKLALLERDRYATLAAQGAVNRQQYDQARTEAATAEARVETARATYQARLAAVKSAQEQLAAAQGSLTRSRSTTLNPEIRQSQLRAYRQQKQQAIAKLAAAEARVRNAQANQAQIQKRLDAFKVVSPISGVVQDRPLEPGAVVTMGNTLLTVINPQAVYLRAYVPEGDLGKIYVGKEAKVFLDSYPNQPLPAKVSAIDPNASFTPENIYFPEDRVRQVFGIKLAIEQEKPYAKPGMPADAEISLE